MLVKNKRYSLSGGETLMTQYLITTFIQHKHVAKLKDNQTFKVVEAECKSEAVSNCEEGYND